METVLLRTALKKDYVNLFDREDEDLTDLSHLVLSMPHHILAADSVRYVRFISMRLSLLLPNSHSEIKETGQVWEDYIFMRGTLQAVKDKLRLMARLRRASTDAEERMLLRTVSTFLRLTEGEHRYMEGMLLYLSWAVRKEWRKNGEYAVTPEFRNRLINEVIEDLLMTKERISKVRKSAISRSFTRGQYSTELMERIRMSEEEKTKIRRKAEHDLRLDEWRKSPDRERIREMKEKRERLNIMNGRSRMSQLHPELKPLLDRMDETVLGREEEAYSVFHRFLRKEFERAFPELLPDFDGITAIRNEWKERKTTAVSLRRRTATFIQPVMRRQDLEEMYLSAAFAYLMTREPVDIRLAVDTYLVIFLDTPEKASPALEEIRTMLLPSEM